MNRLRLLMLPEKNDCFHVHTLRCGHAEDVSDEEYIKKAMELGAGAIWFSDHAPFPGDPFGNRMKYEQLDEYINTLTDLKKRYEEQILSKRCNLSTFTIPYIPAILVINTTPV